MLPIYAFLLSLHVLQINKSPISLERWRSSTLGSGTDFFRSPESQMARINLHLVDEVGLEACAVLSNCARFEVMICCRSGSPPPVTGVIECLLQHAEVNEDPADVDVSVISGTSSALRHVAHVAAGLSNPKRPFNPYSSRDAHIMLQLKRALSASAQTTNVELRTLIETALTAGKLARDPGRMPRILVLKEYKGGRWSGNAPKDLLDGVVRDIEESLEAVVEEGVEKIRARSRKGDIEILRKEGRGSPILHELTRGVRDGTLTLEEALSSARECEK